MDGTHRNDPRLAAVRRPRLVVLDDSSDDVFLLAYSLRRGGVTCDVVHVPDLGALKAALRVEPDLLLVDYFLRGLAYSEVVEAIQPYALRCPVVLLSGNDDPQAHAACQQLGIELRATKDHWPAAVRLVQRLLHARSAAANRS